MRTMLRIAVLSGLMLCAGCAAVSDTDSLPGPNEAQTSTSTRPAPTSQPPTRPSQTTQSGNAYPFARAPTAPTPFDGTLPTLPFGIQTETFNIRLTGDDTQGANAFLVRVKQLRAVADNHELQVELSNDAVDLAFQGNAWLLGKVKVPTNASRVDFLLQLDDFGGYEATGTAAAVDMHAVPITWTSQLDWMRQHGHTVVHLDVAKSLVPQYGELRLLPRLQVLH